MRFCLFASEHVADGDGFPMGKKSTRETLDSLCSLIEADARGSAG